MTTDDASLPAWNAALAFALTGERQAELGHQPRPDPALVADHLRGRLSVDALAVAARSWYPVPADLAVGMGAAQFEAALSALRALLTETGATPPPRRVGRDRALTSEEQRLLREVPPHHG